MEALTFSSLPIIDIGPLREQLHLLHPQDAEVEKVVKQLDHACRDIGFFYVKNHGISSDLLNSVLHASRSFFALHDEEKAQIKMTSSTFYRGYQMLGLNVTKGQLDQHEAIDFFKEFESNYVATSLAKPLMGPNQWPDRPYNLRPLLEHYIAKMTGLARSIMQGIALALGGPYDAFEGKCAGDPFWILRLIGYPPKVDLTAHGKDQEPVTGCGEHTDYGLLTIVNQDPDVIALQVKNHDGGWSWIEPVAGAFVVNIGDMLKIWSNGIYQPTLHRVMNQDKYRVSVPFFYEPNFEAYVEPLEFCKLEAGDNFTCAPVVYGEHVVNKVLTNFG